MKDPSHQGGPVATTLVSDLLATIAREVRNAFQDSKHNNPGAQRLWVAIEQAVASRRPHHLLLMHNLALRVGPDAQLLKLISTNDLRHEGEVSTPYDKVQHFVVATIMYILLADPELIRAVNATHYTLHQGEDGLYTGYFAQARTTV